MLRLHNVEQINDIKVASSFVETVAKFKNFGTAVTDRNEISQRNEEQIEFVKCSLLRSSKHFVFPSSITNVNIKIGIASCRERVFTLV
jgi:hypothetical protein